MTDHLRVIIESPYAAPTPEELAIHVDYARACLRDSLLRGEAPIASHLLYTQPGVLRDEVPEERLRGINAGLAWREVADVWVFYLDLGWSRGMRAARMMAEREGRPIVLRILGDGTNQGWGMGGTGPIRPSLGTMARKGLWPTPRAIYGEHPGMTDEGHLTGAVQAGGASGQLNPTWVEWLMGYPLGWTDLNVSEIALCRK